MLSKFKTVALSLAFGLCLTAPMMANAAQDGDICVATDMNNKTTFKCSTLFSSQSKVSIPEIYRAGYKVVTMQYNPTSYFWILVIEKQG